MVITVWALLVGLALGVGLDVAGAAPEVTRSISPNPVNPGGTVTNMFQFTTTEDNILLYIRDEVPLNWEVTDISATVAPFLTSFHAANGTVAIAWVGLDPGVEISAGYLLHVPSAAEPQGYALTGVLCGITEAEERWCISDFNRTVTVKQDYGVRLSVDEEEKTTDLSDTATYNITVENIGDNPDTYTLSKVSQADFAQLSKTSVSLGSGGSEVVTLNVGSGVPGNYTTIVSATSGQAYAEVLVNTLVREYEDNEPPEVTPLTAEPYVIPEDTDNNPLWGEVSTLSVIVVDESEINSVTIDLSALGGNPEQPMSRIGTSNVWGISVNASVGTANWHGSAYLPYLLQVTATDECTNANTSSSIELLVMKNGDVNEDGLVDFADVTYLANHVVRRSGYEAMEDTIADVNGNSDVDFADVTYLANHVVRRSGYGTLK